MQIQARRTKDDATKQLMRQQLEAVGASDSLIKLLTGEYRDLALRAPTPNLALGQKNNAPAAKPINAASPTPPATPPAGVQGATPGNNQAANKQPNITGAPTTGNQPHNQTNTPQGGAPAGGGAPTGGAAAQSTGILAKFRNKVAVAFGIGAIALAGFLGFGSRFRSSSEPSSKPTSTQDIPADYVTGRTNAPAVTVNELKLPDIGLWNGTLDSSTNATVQPPFAIPNSVTESKVGTSEAEAPATSATAAPKPEASAWYNMDPLNIFDGALSFLKPTRPPFKLPESSVAAPQTASTNAPSASASTSAAQKPAEPKPLVNDFSKHSNEELNKLASEFRSVALKALPNIAEGQQHAPEDLAKAQAAAEVAAAHRGIDLLALEDTIRGRAAAERYKALSNAELAKIWEQYNEVFAILTPAFPNDEAKVRTEVAKAAAKKGDHLGALIAEVQVRNAKADAAAQQATTPQVTPTGADASQTNSAPKTAVAPARTGAATSTPGAVPGDTLPGHSFKLPAIKLTPLAERPAPPPAVGSPRAMATHPEMFTPSANDYRFNHTGELAQLQQMIDSYEAAAKASPGINPNDRKAVWNKAVELAAGNNVNLDEASQALNLAQVNRSPAKSVRLADPHVPPTEGVVFNDAGWRGLFGLRRTTVLQSTDGAPLVVQKKGLFGTSTYSTPGISQEEARELLTRANGSSTKTSS